MSIVQNASNLFIPSNTILQKFISLKDQSSISAQRKDAEPGSFTQAEPAGISSIHT
jgi:hypothetical protein